MKRKPNQYRITGNAREGYNVVGNFTQRYVNTQSLTKSEADEILDLVNTHCMDSNQSYRGFYA